MPTPEEIQEVNSIKTVPDAVTIEEPWASAFKKAGLVSPVTGEPSIQALNRESGVHPSAISRIISGRTRKPRPSTVMKLASALEVNFVEVAGWIGMSWKFYEQWNPPAESALLTPRQRDIVEQIISELVKTNPGREGGVEAGQDEPAKERYPS